MSLIFPHTRGVALLRDRLPLSRRDRITMGLCDFAHREKRESRDKNSTYSHIDSTFIQRIYAFPTMTPRARIYIYIYLFNKMCAYIVFDFISTHNRARTFRNSLYAVTSYLISTISQHHLTYVLLFFSLHFFYYYCYWPSLWMKKKGKAIWNFLYLNISMSMTNNLGILLRE